MQNKFVFFRNFAEAINDIFDTPEEQAAAYMAICQYGIYGILPEDKTMKAMCLMTNQENQGWGGVREGSGRKRQNQDKSNLIKFNQDELEKLEKNQDELEKFEKLEKNQKEKEKNTPRTPQEDKNKNTSPPIPLKRDCPPEGASPLPDDFFLQEEVMDKKALAGKNLILLDDDEPIPNDSALKAKVIQWWNVMAPGFDLAEIREISKTRLMKLKARIRQAGTLYRFEEAVEDAVSSSEFLRGQNNRGWRADFDFFLSEGNFLKAIEGKYADRQEVLS